MEDGEGGEDESMQEEAEEGRRPLFRKGENQPSSQEVQEHMKTHILLPLLVRSLRQTKGEE